MSLLLDDVYPLSPAGFVRLSVDIPYSQEKKVKSPYKKPFLLPHAGALLGEERFADVSMWWHQEGIGLSILVHKGFEDVSFPNQGDGIELFFDTRDLKEAGSLHKFCHHFVFLPKDVDGVVACEMTKMRADDAHPLCDPRLLHIETTFSKKSYEMHIFLYKEALHGFDPQQFDRLGFMYAMHRKNGPSQHLSISSDEYAIDKYPSLWAFCNLTS